MLVELKDLGSADSDPFLVLTKDKPPTLTPDENSNEEWNDWLSWYYDASDNHLIRASLQPGLYYVGVTNHKWRGKAKMEVNVTVRFDTNSWPCQANCFDHGTCHGGMCRCKEGYLGSNFNSFGRNTCRYHIDPIASLPFSSSEIDLRVGDWAYYKLTVTEEEVRGARLLISLSSFSPRAQPILLVRKGMPPVLERNVIPTYDAFDADFGDEEGFDLLNGQWQNIILHNETLTAGDYYIGLFNVWGYTGIMEASHDTAKIKLYANLFHAGVPCPRDENKFCDGYECDFNIGKCKCPVSRLGSACGFRAVSLTHDKSVSGSLPTGEAMYYVLDVTEEMVAKGNLLLTMTKAKTETDKAYPIVLARKGAVPYAQNYSDYDDHDIASHVYHDQVHQILIDREELSAGAWYFAIINSPDSVETLIFDLTVEFKKELDCPKDAADNMCSNAGQCDRTLGRCMCNKGRTLDDCSADGVFMLPPNTNTDDTDIAPPINVDGWVYYVMGIGCEGLEVQITFRQHDDASTIPLLTMKRANLPLMTEETADYYDYYNGITEHQKRQGIHIMECGNPPCVVYPEVAGTAFGTGFLEPGVHYIGVYNDYRAAEKISDYTVATKVTNSCEGKKCHLGFVNDTCDVMCPGMIPEQAYSNTPFNVGTPCHGHGECVFEGGKAVCKCDPDHFGDACEIKCPGTADYLTNETEQTSCSKRGKCVYNQEEPGKAGETSCECDDGYKGTKCEIVCPGREDEEGVACLGHGKCELSYGINEVTKEYEYEAKCLCDNGYAGDACSASCKNGCNEHGSCQSIHDSHGANIDNNSTTNLLKCLCDEGYLGDQCTLQCPTVADGNVCNGHGTCTLKKATENEGPSAVCACHEGWEGDSCTLACPATPIGVVCSANGVCALEESADGQSATCSCKDGWKGDDCSTQCPGVTDNFAYCNGNGECHYKKKKGQPAKAFCACEPQFVGDDCSLPCPGIVNDTVCNGHGACALGTDCVALAGPEDKKYTKICSQFNRDMCGMSFKKSNNEYTDDCKWLGEKKEAAVAEAVCSCYHGWMDGECATQRKDAPIYINVTTNASSRLEGKTGEDGRGTEGGTSTTTLVLVVVLSLAFAALMIAFFYVYRQSQRRKRELERFSSPLMVQQSDDFGDENSMNSPSQSRKQKSMSGNTYNDVHNEPGTEMNTIQVNVPENTLDDPDPDNADLR